MGQLKSFKSTSLEKQLATVEKELISLKAIQQYSPSQINYSYTSNNVAVASYQYISGSQAQGVIVSLLFTSHFPNIYPKTSIVFSRNAGDHGGVLIDCRTERAGSNQARLYIQAVDTMIPMSTPTAFTANFRVLSNVSGVLTLEKTYVRPGYN